MAGEERYPGEAARRPWFQLEGRHGGLMLARLGALAAVALAAWLVPSGVLPRDAGLALAACACAAGAHALLWLVPLRWPRRLRLAVDASLVVDAAWASALAVAAGGAEGPMTGAFLVTALWAALGYSARTGLKAGLLASLSFLALVWHEEGGELWSPGSVGRLILFWAVLASAVVGAAAGERELRVRAERLGVLHQAARDLILASDSESMTAVARAAAQRLLPDWHVAVRRGRGPDGVRLSRVGGTGVIAVPVTGAGGALGVIECRRELPAGAVRHRVRRREIIALETLAAALGGALWRADLTAALERRSLTDGLTGLFNRRGFDRELSRELSRSRRSGHPVALCLMDIDRFKELNDAHGHPAGDEVLRSLAGAVGESLREGDLFARYGGEEFALILPATDLADAAQVADRVREAVAAHPMPHRRVTVSVGVASTPGDDPPEALVAAADRALYRAKEAGRDRVETEAEPAVAPSA